MKKASLSPKILLLPATNLVRKKLRLKFNKPSPFRPFLEFEICDLEFVIWNLIKNHPPTE
jgi:hypothetical protein